MAYIFIDTINNFVNETGLFFLGQAGFILKSKSGTILTIDPYLTDCVEKVEGHIGFKRLLPQILSPDEIVFDAIIATHEHMDHYDKDAMPIMIDNGKTILYTTLGCKKLVKENNINEDRVVYIRPGDDAEVGDMIIHFINCDHGKDVNAVGVIVEVDGIRLYEAGDTCLRLDRIDEVLAYGAIDVMLAPINGKYGNLNESDCAKLSDAIKPELTIPCHYGMFASHGGNPGKFYDIMRKEYPERNIYLMRLGEGICL